MLGKFIFVICALSWCECNEPRSCSQFNCFEQLLERVLKNLMEMNVNSLHEKIIKTNSETISALNELKQERDNFQNDIMVFKNQMKTELKSEVKTEMSTISESWEQYVKKLDKNGERIQNETNSALEALKQEKNNFQNDIMVFENQMKTEMKTEMKDIRESLLTPILLFKARTVKNQNPSTGETIVFTNIMMNYGDGYDSNTGVFTSPVNGTYIFIIHMCLRPAKVFQYNIVHDNTIYTGGTFFSDKSEYTCHTADALLYLQAGYKVWLECSASGSSNYYKDVLKDYSSSTYNYWTTFSGMLVHA